MTQDTGYGVNNYFSKTLEKTVELQQNGEQVFLQKYRDEETGEYDLYVRNGGRYNSLEPVSTGLSSEADAEQLFLEAEERGLENLLDNPNGCEWE